MLETEAELNHALVVRDILIAKINALSDQLEQVYQSNAARVLDAKTLDAIQAQYNLLRQSLLTRVQAVARLAENAFNFERDADTHLIRDAYYDTGLEGYTAAETLLHDLGGFDHIDLIGRTRKAMQLSHVVSLSKHNPMSFLALAATGNGRFTTTLEDFDRWYPGTYLQRIKEVRVEVLADGEVVPARGYLSTGSRLSASSTRRTSVWWTMSASSTSRTPTSPSSATSGCSGGATSILWPSRSSSRTSMRSGCARFRGVSATSSRMLGSRAPG
jgi:hypothetical protein